MTYPIPKAEIETVMNEGSQAFNAKLTMRDCPYSKFGDKGRLWLRGFANAAYGMSYGSQNT